MSTFFGDNEHWSLSVFFLCLCFGFSGIPFAWIAFGILTLLLHFLFSHRTDAPKRLLPLVPVSLLIAAFVLLPQFASLLPRFEPTFSFSLPHVWFPAIVQKFAPNNPVFGIWIGFMTLLMNMGFFLVAGALASCVFIRDKKMIPLCMFIIVSAALLTCTSTVKTDWYGRGTLVLTISSSLLAAQLFFPLIKKGWSVAAVTLVSIFGLQVLSTIVEAGSLLSSPPDAFSIKVNHQYPFGTVFYQKENSQPAEDVFVAGRAFIGTPPEAYTSYLNHPDVLQNVFGALYGFAPCSQSRFGTNTPFGRYMIFGTNGLTEKDCP